MPLEVGDDHDQSEKFTNAGNLAEVTISRTRIQAELISSGNLSEAIQVCQACFDDKWSKESIRQIYSAYVKGPKRFEPESGCVGGTLIEYFAYRKVSGKIVATGGLYHSDDCPDTELSLGWLGVHPKYRGNGYGSSLVRHLEERARQLGAAVLSVYTDKEDEAADAARALYCKHGYVEVPDRAFMIEIEGEQYPQMVLVKRL